MCPYIQANRMALLKELHKNYLSKEENSWLPTPNEGFHDGPSPTPTEKLVVVDNQQANQTPTSQLTDIAQACVEGKVNQASCSETFHAEPEDLAKAIAKLESILEPSLKIKRLGQKILNQTLQEPASVNRLRLEAQTGTFTFWANVGYHQSAKTLEGSPTYGIHTSLGFSFQKSSGVKEIRKAQLTNLFNPKKESPKKPARAKAHALTT
jgi:hypothetical protein